MRQTATLEHSGWVECDPKNSQDRMYRLTEKGRLHALGGRDPEREWARSWDGRWRMLLFDIPVSRNTERNRLRRYLKNHYFGCLQGSVWVTPNPMKSEHRILREGDVNVNSLLLLEAQPCAGESDEEIVTGAWDFPRINSRYQRVMEILARFIDEPVVNNAAARDLQKWLEAERKAWLASIEIDPLLPKVLLPTEYLGSDAWEQRKTVLTRAATLLRKFKSDR